MNEPVDHRGFPLWDVVKLAAADAKEFCGIKPAPEPAKPPMTLGDLLRGMWVELGKPVPQPAEPKRPALTWNAKTEADRFPGFTVTRSNADAPGYAGSFPTSDTASHQVTPKFGSSDLA